jgi:hypothetical protein
MDTIIRLDRTITHPSDLVLNGAFLDAEMAAGREIVLMVTIDEYEFIQRRREGN